MICRRLRSPALLLVAAAMVAAGCAAQPAAAPGPRPSRIPDPPSPTANPTTPDKVALGKQLFFDRRVSGPGTYSCETCHVRDKGWTDGLPLSPRADGTPNTRHSPTMYNVGYLTTWYWDGRSPTLESQILAAWRVQMVADPAVVAARLAAIPGYREAFQRVFGGPPAPENIPMALAAFLRTLRSGDSPWDRYEMGDRTAVPTDAVAGHTLFTGKARCVACHYPPLYTDSLFHNVGLEHDKARPDPGRFNVTRAPKDTGAFKTPTLRSVAISGPYFHDGSVVSLEEAVRYMTSGGKPDPNKDPLLIPAVLTDREIAHIVAFLRSLTSDEPLVRPTLP
jgi:cytochrome c peroxidase